MRKVLPVPAEHFSVSAAFLVAAALAGPLAGQGVEELVAEGRQRFEKRQYFPAIEAFRRARELASETQRPTVSRHLASAYGALGAEYFNAGENRLAEETFRKGLEFAGNYYSHFGLGFLYFMRLENGDSLKQLQAALKYKPDFAGTHKLLALLDYRQGRTGKALERLAEAQRFDPKDGETNALLKRWRVESTYSSQFRELTIDSFLVRVDPAIPRATRDVLLVALEKAHGEIGDSLGIWPREKITVILFGEKSFHEATGSYHWVGGMYDGQLKIPVPTGSSRPVRESVREVIRHEYTHVLIRRLAPECPVWLNEGIAQHYEKSVDLDSLARQLRAARGRRMALEKIPARLWAVDDVDLARQSYLQGHGFVEYLVESFHEFRLRLLLSALAEEHSLGKAFERTFGLSLGELEEGWWRDVERRGRPTAAAPEKADGKTP